jgi:hypothetical protein
LTVNRSSFLLSHTIYLSHLDDIIEQQMTMSDATMFWIDTLYHSNLSQSLQLTFHRHRLNDENHNGREISVEFDFGEHISCYFLTYASSNNLAPIHVPLTSCYIFLLKLAKGGLNVAGKSVQ